MMFPQPGVTELVFTLIQQMIKYDTNCLITPCRLSTYSMPYITTYIICGYYCHSLLHYCQLLRTLRATVTKRRQYMKYRSVQIMYVQDALPTN